MQNKFLVAFALILATSYATLSSFTVTNTFGSTEAGWPIYGAASDKLGSIVTDLGDFNGDGYVDYAIASTTTSLNVYIILGQSAGRTAFLDIVTATATAITTNNFYTITLPASGVVSSMAGGDINGDNTGDLAIADVAAKKVYVVYGKGTTTWATWTAIANLAAPTAMRGFIVQTTVSAGLGTSMAIADFADDTKGDLIIGMPLWADASSNVKGAICVVHGKANAATDIASAKETRGNTAVACDTLALLNVASPNELWEGNLIIGGTNTDGIGQVVAAGVDMNGDNYEDIFTTSLATATAYIVYGAANRVAARADAVAIDLGTATTRLAITTPGVNFITSANFIGDFNGDGRTDLALGYPSYLSGLGRVYVLFGQANKWTAITPPLDLTDATQFTSTYGIHYTGLTSASYFGTGVDGTDVNKDGVSDLIVSAPLLDAAARVVSGAVGKVHIIYGSTTNTANVALATAALNGITITGAAETGFGTSITALGGDVNADTVADFVVTAPLGTKTGSTSTGIVYEFRGQKITSSGSGFRLHFSVLALAGFLVALLF